ncbi:hypothetical protein IWQ60_000833 [Tieghemiomyces parasiticus]|uniref:Uncharacterized protein n=1 Tax=Tieghemiomyces parasiticus TaxID=78921 RepID=A0A9W8AI37_9FUNG|nr:hypothetical protein IWQ60_000833 [Tieghemiomyces parasiticus]
MRLISFYVTTAAFAFLLAPIWATNTSLAVTVRRDTQQLFRRDASSDRTSKRELRRKLSNEALENVEEARMNYEKVKKAGEDATFSRKMMEAMKHDYKWKRKWQSPSVWRKARLHLTYELAKKSGATRKRIHPLKRLLSYGESTMKEIESLPKEKGEFELSKGSPVRALINKFVGRKVAPKRFGPSTSARSANLKKTSTV